MAASKSCYRYLTGVADHHRSSPESHFEFDESDVWNSATSSSPEFRTPVPAIRRKISPAVKTSDPTMTVPVNVPDWSKEKRWDGDDVYGGGDDVYGGRSWVPPHEYLARTRIASLSVQEGKGRTLKGRDLRRVRNAIWEKTGFQD